MPRASLLTSGLDALAEKSPAIARLLTELFTLDDVLQDAHTAAKQDDENGERVVQAYEAFLQHRARLIAHLETERIAVPWQLRMRIDDIELTLRQRKEKREAAAGVGNKLTEKKEATIKTKTNPVTSSSTEESKAPESDGTEEQEKEDPLLLLKALILPSALVGIIASVMYAVATFT